MKYFTVGPTQTYAGFEKHLHQALVLDVPSLSHRSAYFTDMYRDLCLNIRKLFKVPKDYHVVFLGSATECMERAIQNMSLGETLHFVSGTFGERAYLFARDSGRNAIKVGMREDGSFSLSDIPSGVEPDLVFLTHSETSVGNQLPKKFISSIRAQFPKSCIALDIVSSAPTADIELSELDCVFFSVQKGMGLPAGLAVCILSPRAIASSELLKKGGNYTGLFHAFSELVRLGKDHKTLETPNVLLMHLLNERVRALLAQGLPSIRAEQKNKMKSLYDVLEKSQVIQPAIRNKLWRSSTVIVGNTPSGSKKIIDAIKNCGILIASGYGKDKDIKVRIANFPQHNISDVKKICKKLAQL